MPEDQNQPSTEVSKAATEQPVVSTDAPVAAVETASGPHLSKLPWTKSHLLTPQQRQRERWLFVALVVSLVLLILTFLAYDTSLVFGRLRLANQSVSASASDSALTEQITRQSHAYRFTLRYPDKAAQTFSLSDAGMGADIPQTLADLHSAKRNLGWQRFAFWRTTTVPLAITKNNKQFQAFVDQHITIANQDPSDASIAVSAGKPVITDGTAGWTYSLPGGNQQLGLSATMLKPLDVAVTKTTTAPNITRANLTDAAGKITAFTAHSVSFNLPSRTVTASASDIGGWLDIQPVPEHKTADVTVNSGKVQAWLDKATRGDVQPPRSQITTTDDAGNTTVLISGMNGMSITNKAAAVSSVASQLGQSTPAIHADLAVSYQNYSTINAADYPKWIVVDLTTKRMYAYEHASLVRSFLVSAGAPKTPTVVGTYHIYSKYVSKDMRGRNADGSRYFQPHVHYVNFFYRDYAIHGNYWRPSSYFGNINSSHGCVGITDGDAAWVYNWAPIGTTVITHN